MCPGFKSLIRHQNSKAAVELQNSGGFFLSCLKVC